MNRRNFLKRIAAIAAGAVAVPTIAKRLPFRPNPVQARYTWEYSHIGKPYGYSPPSKPSKHPEYPLGTLYYAANGTVYRYVWMEQTSLIGE